jgi:hypothetical protein
MCAHADILNQENYVHKSGYHNPLIEGKTTQWPKEKEQKKYHFNIND